MRIPLQVSGPAQYRAKSTAVLCGATAEVFLSRLRNGPRCDSWNLAAELGTEILKRQLVAAFKMTNVEDARRYLNSLALHSSAISRVKSSDVIKNSFKGSWVIPENIKSDTMVLYLHGGGYAFYPTSFYNNLAALIALSTRSRMFSLDYRLTPEHRFPSQLQDAMNCYRWLIRGSNPRRLVVVGDSAGGNLALALLLSLHDSGIPLPALAICLSPATDFEEENAGANGPASPEYDWITREMALRWADWYCTPEERRNPLVSPINANLRGLPPIYIQAGGEEILLNSIQEFVKQAKEQGADVTLETWPSMNHDFQAFGYDVPESVEAIRRIGEVTASHMNARKKQ